VTDLSAFEPFAVDAGGLVFDGVAAGPVDGRLVLLLHGFPESSYEWRFALPALAAAGYRAVAFDQRGYSPGARPEGVEHYRIDHLVADVLAVADDMGGHRFDLVGHDWGAAVAWHVAARYPDRVRTLTAVSVPHVRAFGAALASKTGDQARRSTYMQEFRSGGGEAEGAAALLSRFDFADDPAPYIELLSQPGALTAALNWYRAMAREDSDRCGPVRVPTLYVWSDGDVAIGREAADGCAAHVEGPYRFEALSGVSHWIPEEAPEPFNRLLLDHLAGHGQLDA
jgi:pimeloyl-ACP methyl ester carboxylesterase